MKSQEEILAARLAEAEERRTVYWNKFDPFVDLRMGWRASMMRHLFHILPGQRILEIGAGNGRFAKALREITRGECEITSVVFDGKYQVDFIMPKDKGIHLVQADCFPGPLSGEKFDYIVAQDMMEGSTRDIFLYAIKALLKPGGGLLLFEPNSWNPYYRIRRMVRRLLPISWSRPAQPPALNRLQILSILSEIGYIQVNALPYDFLYPPIPKFLLWPAQNLSIIMENCPYLKNFAGSLYIWARNPALEMHKSMTVDLCEHQSFFGKVSFVIPCHNEEMNVRPLVKGLKDFYDKYIFEIIVVDDNSRDKTAETAEALAKEDSRIRVIRRSPPNGVGFALRDGLAKAEGEYVVIMDSDFQHIIPEMRDLFDAVAGGADVAVGSRFSRKSVLLKYDFSKIIANRAFHILANLLLGKHFRDISNNLKIFRRDVIKHLNIESDAFSANVETGLTPIMLGYRVAEVPISWVNRDVEMGVSTFKIFKAGPGYFKILMRFLRYRMTGKWRNESRDIHKG